MFRTVLAAAAVAAGLTAGTGAASKWLRVTTPHFVVIGEVGQRPLRQVAVRFEQFREVFSRVFPRVRQTPAAPIQVVAFGSERAYQPFMPIYNGKRVEVGGLFVSTPGASYVSLRSDLGDQAYPVVFHEYTHLLVRNTLADVPVWLDEGLAEYYATLAMAGEKQATIGRANESHVLQLRERLMPLAELVAVRRDSPLYNEGERRSIFYAESWALVHYLLMGNPERRPQLAVFLDRHGKGMATAQAFQEAFGVDEAGLQRELQSYVQRSTYQSQAVTFTERLDLDRDVRVEPVEDADAEALLADMLLHMNRNDDAALRAQKALGLARDHPRALAVLGRAKGRQGQAVIARTLLEDATTHGPDDYLTNYYRGLVMLRPDGERGAMRADEATARPAVPLLEKAVALQPELADAQMLLGYARLAAGDPAGAVAPLNAAHRLSPRHEYALLLAQAQVGAGDYAQARPLLTSLEERGSSPEIQKSAGELLKRVHLLEKTPRGQLPAADAGNREDPAPAEPAEEPPAAARSMPVLRPLERGETRVKGRLVAIDCAGGRIVLQIESDEGPLALEAGRFDEIEFISYRDDLRGDVKCGPRSPADAVHATWRRGAAGQKRAVAIEFMPDDPVR